MAVVSSPLKREFTQAQDQTDKVQQPAKSNCSVNELCCDVKACSYAKEINRRVQTQQKMKDLQASILQGLDGSFPQQDVYWCSHWTACTQGAFPVCYYTNILADEH